MSSEIKNVLLPVVDSATKVLIVGSMPGKQSLEKQQYYGNPRNHFWPIMSELLETEVPDDYVKRIALLKHNAIGLWDTVETCEREGSLDAAIRNEKPNDFQTLFEEYPNIQLVLFNGAKAFEVFKKHIGLELLEERAYKKMPSTSPIPGKNIKSFAEKLEDWRIIQSYLSS
ncbi:MULTISPECIES: DNA-deoxyinosine glycosylase [unclassified Lysinibacillus]|uniref:DNA-deoxyinosine glycosylase n=1 Tax=unclassified Lysinibacillus TaxID=2636778 RepID=UPI00088D8679|nr:MULTISPECIES: DNA-deoxyinosine glycosylase [unclassified Lysinibacillus]SCY84873.1 G/U mismatch-specific uracil-DNA glycosylase [Lysinibacillus sp. SG9]SDB36940.1 G/U mismatch-specific uracil-DNA glycosylase [Lysinibacillus sp. TC-37]SFS80055.1 G/U mismatch-specific uracil-DNA glycosylase [Lysinibacillus sp. SG55]